jgi:hypothetical protein
MKVLPLYIMIDIVSLGVHGGSYDEFIKTVQNNGLNVCNFYVDNIAIMSSLSKNPILYYRDKNRTALFKKNRFLDRNLPEGAIVIPKPFDEVFKIQQFKKRFITESVKRILEKITIHKGL